MNQYGEKKESDTCSSCQYCWKDTRHTDYIRPPYFFCQKKGSFFSRNYRVGEKTRIDPDFPACPEYRKK